MRTRKVVVAVAAGGLGGSGFSWILSHVPLILAMILATIACITLVTWMWTIHRDMRRLQRESIESEKEFLAFLERVRQTAKAGEN